MSEATSENPLPSYDNEQARQFYRTATNPQRLPKKYWQGEDVKFEPFVDAVIGQYGDSVERKHKESRESWSSRSRTDPDEIYRRELARIAAAIEYVQDVPIADINQAGLDNPIMQKEGAFNYVLKVAKDGAKEIKRIHSEDQSDQPPAEKTQLSADKKSSEIKKNDALEVLPSLADLEYRIILLHRDGLIKEATAGSLIMLFEFQKSTASPEWQIEVLKDIRTVLERKITDRKFDEAYADGGMKDKTLETGMTYLTQLIGLPRRRKLGLRPYQLVKRVWEDSGKTSNQLIARDHVHSHIAYALEKMYRP